MAIISVIIPVYNAEKYIERCVGSILSQTFTDFELILVNDGSADGSLALCESFAGKDSRVNVVNKTNGGASSARNYGIDAAKGDYICFVDADDYVGEKYLEQLYQDQCLDKEIDLVMHGMIQVKGGSQIAISLPKSKTYSLEKDTFFEDVNLFKFCGPCCKLFKRDLIENYRVRYNESIIYSEDFDFLAKYLIHSAKVRTSEAKNYFYEAHANTVSTRIYSFDQEKSGLSYLYSSLSVLNDKFNDPALDKQIKNYIAHYMSRVLTSVYEPPRPGRSVRIKKLKSIDRAFVQLYRDYFLPPTMNNKVFKLLYVSKCYRVFDMASLMWRRKMEKRK